MKLSTQITQLFTKKCICREQQFPSVMLHTDTAVAVLISS